MTVNSHDGGDAAAVTGQLVPPPSALALGSGQFAGLANEAAFGGEQAAGSLATGNSSEADIGGLTNDLHGIGSHLLSSLLNVLNGSEQGAVRVSDSAPANAAVAPVTSVLDGKHLTDSTIVEGAGSANSEVAFSTELTAPTSERDVAPVHGTAPTLASATLGGLDNDSFTFHPNLGSETASNTHVNPTEFAHNEIQASPALASIAPEFHQEFAFDAIHQDASNLSAHVDQFHQIVANSTLLH